MTPYFVELLDSLKPFVLNETPGREDDYAAGDARHIWIMHDNGDVFGFAYTGYIVRMTKARWFDKIGDEDFFALRISLADIPVLKALVKARKSKHLCGDDIAPYYAIPSMEHGRAGQVFRRIRSWVPVSLDAPVTGVKIPAASLATCFHAIRKVNSVRAYHVCDPDRDVTTNALRAYMFHVDDGDDIYCMHMLRRVEEE